MKGFFFFFNKLFYSSKSIDNDGCDAVFHHSTICNAISKCRDATGNYAFIKPAFWLYREFNPHHSMFSWVMHPRKEWCECWIRACHAYASVSLQASSIHFSISEVVSLMSFPHVLWLALQYRITQSAAHQLYEARQTRSPSSFFRAPFVMTCQTFNWRNKVWAL